jgi:hypothetical protein
MIDGDLSARAARLAAQLRSGRDADRAAANGLVDEIDAAVRELYRARESLTGAVRVFDDATNARIDELLKRRKGGAAQ